MITEEIETDIKTLQGLGYLVQCTAHYSVYEDDAANLKEALAFISNSMYDTLKGLEKRVSTTAGEENV